MACSYILLYLRLRSVSSSLVTFVTINPPPKPHYPAPRFNAFAASFPPRIRKGAGPSPRTHRGAAPLARGRLAGISTPYPPPPLLPAPALAR